MATVLPTTASQSSNNSNEDIINNMFEIPPEEFGKLVDPKDKERYVNMGGLKGIALSLRVDIKIGLPDSVSDEVETHRIQQYLFIIFHYCHYYHYLFIYLFFSFSFHFKH